MATMSRSDLIERARQHAELASHWAMTAERESRTASADDRVIREAVTLAKGHAAAAKAISAALDVEEDPDG